MSRTRNPLSTRPLPRGEGPRLGIFWLVGGKLVLASTPLDDCELYGEVLNEPRSHVDYWVQLQANETVPRDMEYEEAPRGRIVYNVKTKQFTLMADRCILARHDMVKRLLSELHLPKSTKLDTDYHYRCSVCLYGKDDDDE
jgi:hypothetical protein